MTNSPNRDPHVFRLTQSFSPGGGVNIVIVSWDASIVHILRDDFHWNNEFRCGEHKIYVEGYWDHDDDNIYLGKRIEGLDW